MRKRERKALHQALAVPPPGPTIGPNVTVRPLESASAEDGAADSLGAGKSSEIGAETDTKQ